MAEFTATVVWQRATDPAEPFTDQRYSRRHAWQFDGGFEMPASSSPHSVPLPFSDPTAVDPEEAFVASLSSCHMLWFLHLAAKGDWVVDRYTDAAVGQMARNADGRMAMTVVCLRPDVRFDHGHAPTRAELEQLHHAAHEACYIANSVKTEVLCEPVFEPV